MFERSHGRIARTQRLQTTVGRTGLTGLLLCVCVCVCGYCSGAAGATLAPVSALHQHLATADSSYTRDGRHLGCWKLEASLPPGQWVPFRGKRMSLDIQNCCRGRCLSCNECPSFICVSGRVLCDYCGCPPARHQKQEPGEDLEEAVWGLSVRDHNR